jgi:DNA-binding HxlR family transcriptional regulator
MDKGEPALCPKVEAAFCFLSKKWAGLIVFLLGDGERYFSELEAAIPDLSARVLALRVRDLEKAGIVMRRVSQTSPVRVSYCLTEKGRSLAAILSEFAEWAQAQG